MTTVRYAATSPYANTPQSNTYLEYLGYWQGDYLAFKESDQLVTLGPRYLHRPDLLSNDLYGTPAYWWVFSLRNPDIITDPIFDMKPGTTIYVPAKTDLPVGGL